jgi:hypothetical protein
MNKLQAILDIPMGSVVEKVSKTKRRGRGRPAKRMDIVSEANNRDHWTVKRKRRILHDNIIRKYFIYKRVKVNFPCIVKLSRVAMRKLDDDNLQGALKSIRDSVADLLLPGMPRGRADGDPRIQWQYGQIRGPKGLRIEIYEPSKENKNESAAL